MCGAVSFTVADAPTSFGACHCDMCRRWTGSALLAMTVPDEKIAFASEDNISRIQSSDWAERAFCSKCGTGLWYRVTAEGFPPAYEIPVGLFDDANGLSFDSEIFIDCKPDSFAYSGERKNVMTRAEVFAKYAPGVDV
jgi:hypothetical protein